MPTRRGGEAAQRIKALMYAPVYARTRTPIYARFDGYCTFCGTRQEIEQVWMQPKKWMHTHTRTGTHFAVHFLLYKTVHNSVQQECTADVQQTLPKLAWQAVLEGCCTKTVHAVQNCTELCTADVQHVYSSVQQGKHDRQHVQSYTEW